MCVMGGVCVTTWVCHEWGVKHGAGQGWGVNHGRDHGWGVKHETVTGGACPCGVYSAKKVRKRCSETGSVRDSSPP